MRKKGKKLLSLVLALIMVVGLLPTAALAADSDFTIENGVLTKYNGPGGAVTIPDSVTSIGDWAFLGSTGLTNVTIPDSVISIGERAFDCCVGLTSVTIGNSVISIGANAFWGCTGLTSVTIPDSVISIGGGAFDRCVGLTSVTIGNSVISIGENAFYGCTGLTSVTIPESVTIIGDYAFRNCEGLTYLTIPNGVTSIGVESFCGCVGLTRVTIPNSVASIGKGAFWDCAALTSVTIPNGVTNIGDSTFSGCTGLTSVTIPDSVTIIDDWAFNACMNLANVYYGGGETQWRAITIMDNNEPIKKATIHYNNTGITERPTIKGYKVYCCGDGEVFTTSLEYLMKKPSSQYNPELAHMLIAMCNSVYSEDDIAKTFDSFGFSYKEPRIEEDFITYSVAKTQMEDGTPLILAVIKGTGSFSVLPWEENDNLGWGSNGWGYVSTRGDLHSGYADAADKVYRDIKDLLKGDTEDLSKAKFILTGFSRGAATANILAAMLNGVKVAQSHIYAYTFACPDTTRSGYPGYDCIFNINDVADFVSWSPNGAFGGLYSEWNKFGHSYWFSNKWDDMDLEMGTDAHNQAKYLEFLRGGEERAYPQVSSFKNRTDSKKILEDAKDKRDQEALRKQAPFLGGRRITRARVKCPVDVKVYSATGELLGSIINNEVKAASSEKIFLYVSGNEKQIYFFGDEQYDVRISGTDTGTMIYTLEHLDVDAWETSDEQTISPVEITKGKQLSSKVEVKDGAAALTDQTVKLYVLDGSGQPEKEVLPDGKGTEIPYTPAAITFTDVPAGSWYYDAVYWAVERGITSGTGTNPPSFTPERTCTEVEILTFLWRTAGEPGSTAQLPFTPKNSWAADALRWAHEKGMIDASFSESNPCTRSTAAKFIWQAAGSPATAAANSFTDVPAGADYVTAVAWAVEQKVTQGTGDGTTFSPNKTCTRAEIVTLLHRAYK